MVASSTKLNGAHTPVIN